MVDPTPAGGVPAGATGTSRRTLLLTARSATVGPIVTFGINLAIIPLVLHRLGPGLYGAWATIAAVLTIGLMADIGLRTEIIRRVAEASGAGDDAGAERAVHEGLTLLAALAFALLCAGALAAPLIRTFAFPDGVPGYGGAGLDQLTRAVFALLAVSLVGNGYFGVLRGLQRGDIEILGRMAGVLIGALATLAFLHWGWGLWAMFFGSATQLAISLVWQWRGTVRLVPSLRPRVVRMTAGTTKAYLALSSLILVSQLADVFDNQWDKLMLAHFVGASAVSAFQIGTTMVLQARALACLPLLPLLTAVAELREKDSARMETTFRALAKVGMIMAAVILGGIFVFAPSFFRLWLGDELADAGRAARLFSIAMAINLVGAPLAYRALAEKWHGLAATSAVSNAVVNGGVSAVLTIAIGFDGPLYGSILGNIAGLAVLLVLLRRRLGERWVRPPLGALTVGALSAAALVGLGVDDVGSWPTLLVGAAVYAVVVGAACLAAERVSVRALISRSVTGAVPAPDGSRLP